MLANEVYIVVAMPLYSENIEILFYVSEACFTFFTFCVSRRRRKMYCGHARLCVCLSVCMSVCLSVRGRMPTLLHGPG